MPSYKGLPHSLNSGVSNSRSRFCFYFFLLSLVFSLSWIIFLLRKSEGGFDILNILHHDDAIEIPNDASLYALERSLAKREMEKMQNLQLNLDADGYEVRGFYHTSSWRDHWEVVISEQLKILDGLRKFPSMKSSPKDQHYSAYEWDPFRYYASLLNVTKELYINVAVNADSIASYENIVKLVDRLELKHRNKIVIGYNRTIGRYDYGGATPEKKKEFDSNPELSAGEYSTIMKLKNYCEDMNAKGKKAMVYYIHSKGSCCLKDQRDFNKSVPVATWREYMNAMNIEFPSICIRAIRNKYSACGVENQDSHFSGNFWWADCGHVAKLPPLMHRFEFTEPEFFVLRAHPHGHISTNFGYQCGYSMFNCGVNLYDFECPRSKYRHRIVQAVLGNSLPVNNRSDSSRGLPICRDMASNHFSYKLQEKIMEKYFTP